MGWDWDGVRFRFLHPGPAAGLAASKNANASSCVLHVEAADGASLLMPADIGAAEEAQLQAPPSTVLLLPHHGSAGSSSPALLDAVRPQLAFAQAGYRNRHGHPALATQNRLRERGIALLSSADCGAWRWRSSEPPGREGCWRAQRRRYWHSPLPDDTSELAGPELRADTIPP
jgi:competence protein ComEC